MCELPGETMDAATRARWSTCSIHGGAVCGDDARLHYARIAALRISLGHFEQASDEGLEALAAEVAGEQEARRERAQGMDAKPF